MLLPEQPTDECNANYEQQTIENGRMEHHPLALHAIKEIPGHLCD
jgi:hypothetical protein